MITQSIEVINWPPSFKVINEKINGYADRTTTEPWLRLMRLTKDEDHYIKRELGVLEYVNDEFHITWREITSPEQLLTDIAPLNSYLVWIK